MKERKYPSKLFVIGFLFGVIIYRFYLFVPSIILLIAGTFVKPCYYIGCLILLIDLVISFIWQIRIRNLVLNDNDNPSIQRFQEAFTEDKPLDEVIDVVDDIIDEYEEGEEEN